MRSTSTKRHRTPNTKIVSDFHIYNSSCPTGSSPKIKKQLFRSKGCEEFKELFHADTILYHNPDYKTFIDSECHDFSFSKEETYTNNTKVSGSISFNYRMNAAYSKHSWT